MTKTPARLVSLARSTAFAAALILGGVTLAQAAGDSMSAAPTHGEFGDSCAMGLASGQSVSTDCSLNWTDEDGKILLLLERELESLFPQGPGRQSRESEGVPRQATGRRRRRR